MMIFENEEFGKIRTVEKDGEPWFVGKDAAEALGYSNARDALAKHIETEDKNTVAIRDGIQGNPNMTVINESGVYSLIFGSKLESAKRFKHWVTSEVIPSIRKHGVYATPQTVDKMLADPDIMIQILTQYKEEKIRLAEANKQIAESKPKVVYYDNMVACDGFTNFRETAKIFGVKEKALTKFLIDNKYCYRDKTNIVSAYAKYSNASDKPMFVKKEFMKNCTIVSQTRFTPYGRQKIYQEIQKNEVN